MVREVSLPVYLSFKLWFGLIMYEFVHLFQERRAQFSQVPFPSGYVVFKYKSNIVLIQWYLFLGLLLAINWVTNISLTTVGSNISLTTVGSTFINCILKVDTLKTLTALWNAVRLSEWISLPIPHRLAIRQKTSQNLQSPCCSTIPNELRKYLRR